MRVFLVLFTTAIICSQAFTQTSDQDFEKKDLMGVGKAGARRGEGGKFWYWMKGQKDITNELKAFYKDFPGWKSEIKGNDKEDAKKMLAILENSDKHMRLAEKMFDYAAENPQKLEILWNNPKSVNFLITHPKAVEYLETHLAVAKRFETREVFAVFLTANPELKEKVSKYVEEKKDKDEMKFESLSIKGEKSQKEKK